MSNKLEYFLQFNTNAEKVTAKIDHIESATINVDKAVVKVGKSFNSTIDKINNKLSSLKIQSMVQNIASVADGLDALNAPGLALGTSLSDLSAITGATGDKLKEIEGYARESAKTFGGSAADGVESYKLILSQLSPEIAKVPSALKEMGNSVSVLSKTMGGDTVAATEVLTTAMNQYGISTADPIEASKVMSHMMNVMAAAAKEGSAELPQQKAALEKSGMAAKSAKVNFVELSAALQVLDKAGSKGAEGGTAFRNVLTTLSQGRFLPKETRQELAAAGIDINILSDKTLSFTDRLRPLKKIMHDTALMTKLFDKANKDSAMALINQIDEQERLQKAITGTNTAYEQAEIVMESQAEKNARLKARVDDFKISLFNATNGLMGYASVLGGVARDVGNLIPLFSGFSKVIMFVTNAQKMQALWTGIVSVSTAVWTKVQWALNVALTANPIGIIIVAIGVMVGAIVYLVSKTEGWGAAWKHTVNGAKLLFKAYVEAIKLYFSAVVNGIMIGINKIKLGWYHFKEAVGLGDSSDNKRMIDKIRQDTEDRKQAIIDQAIKVKEAALKAKEEFGKAAGSIKWKVEAETDDSGITPPIVTGTDPNTGSTSAKDKTKTNKAIATGGTKHNYITITMQDLIGVLNVKGSDFKDSAKQMQEQSTDAMLRVLALATTAGN